MTWSEAGCQGHPAGPFDPMGETVYCDGSCALPDLHPQQDWRDEPGAEPDDAPTPSPPLPATIGPFCTCQSIHTDARDCPVHGEQLRRNAELLRCTDDRGCGETPCVCRPKDS